MSEVVLLLQHGHNMQASRTPFPLWKRLTKPKGLQRTVIVVSGGDREL